MSAAHQGPPHVRRGVAVVLAASVAILWPCTSSPQAQAAAAVGLTSVTTLAVDTPSSAYGETVTATAVVSTADGAPAGDVAFTLDGLARKVGLASDGTASFTLPTAPVGRHTLTASFVPTDPAQHQGSTSTPTALEVRKATTRTVVAVRGKRAGRRTRITARVLTAHGTTATGRVSLVLRELGTSSRRVRTRSLREGERTVGLGRLGQGRYRVVIRYSGDRNHTRGPRTTRSFRVRRG